MKEHFWCIFFVIGYWALPLAGQPTVGLMLNTAESYNGYTLFTSNRTSYLIDNCGQVVKEWESDYPPGMSVYLKEDGTLLRTARIGGNFHGGGTGGRIEHFSWDNELLWSFNYSTEQYKQHHDIEPLPNGNILLIAWESIPNSEAVLAGRDPNLLVFSSSLGLWSEKIVELKPIGADSAEVVWEWRLWDHLIQDFDENRANYGAVEEHPELVDLNFAPNFSSTPVAAADWIHLNSIDYNEELDQIVVSSRYMDEFWVIDHSTTTEEAAGHTGGQYGKGGDLLYRWGNPLSYRRGTVAEQQLFGQHDVQWIEEGSPGAGNFLIYNNGDGRPGIQYSSVEEVVPPLNAEGSYDINETAPFAPAQADWSYAAEDPASFFSPRISGTQRLPNGNTLVCEGMKGRFFELSPEGEIVWDYQCPISLGNPVEQGAENVMSNIFRIRRHGEGYPAFDGRMLEPQGPIEINPLPNDCMIISGEETVASVPAYEPLQLLANPVIHGQIQLLNPDGLGWQLTVLNSTGQRIHQGEYDNYQCSIDCANWPAGVYFISASCADNQYPSGTCFTSLRVVIR